MSSKREIGGYFELETFAGEPYHKGAIALNCGRDCFEYLLELRTPTAVWMPTWMCDCQFRVCERMGVPVKWYEIGEDMRPVYDFEVTSDEYLYLMDYYGQLNALDIDKARRASEGRLFVDEAQGFFRLPWTGVDTFYTCRKFFGVSDGAYLYTSDGETLRREIPQAKSYDRMGFVLGRYECSAGEFYAKSSANNARFEDVPILRMSKLTENLMRAIDYSATSTKRKQSFAYLHERLSQRNLLMNLKIPEGAFMYPLLIEDAGNVRQQLSAQGVFIPALWPNCVDQGSNEASVAYRYSANLLPLPVDQRYDEEDMQYMLDALEAAIAKVN